MEVTNGHTIRISTYMRNRPFVEEATERAHIQNSNFTHVNTGRLMGAAAQQPFLRSDLSQFPGVFGQSHYNRVHVSPESLNLRLFGLKGTT